MKERKQMYKHKKKPEANSVITYTEGMTINELANKLNVIPDELLNKIVDLEITINEDLAISFEDAKKLLQEYKKEIKKEDNDMEEYEIRLLKDINTTISSLKKNKSKSSYYYNLLDLEMLYEMCDRLKIENYPQYDDINKISTKRKFMKSVSDAVECSTVCIGLLEKLSKSIDAFYKDIPDYKIQIDNLIHQVSIENNFAYAAEFLRDYDIRYFNVFLSAVRDARFIMMNELNGKSCGCTYFGYGNFDPYVFVVNYNSIFSAYTMVHETTHLFDYSIAKNWTSNEIEYSYLNFSREINPYYSELMFIDYFKKKRVLKDDMNKVFSLFNGELKELNDEVLNELSNIDVSDDSFIVNDILYSDMNILFGKAVALYFAAMEDRNKALKLITNVLCEARNHDLIDSLTNSKVDINDIAEFGSASEYIRKRLM